METTGKFLPYGFATALDISCYGDFIDNNWDAGFVSMGIKSRNLDLAGKPSSPENTIANSTRKIQV